MPGQDREKEERASARSASVLDLLEALLRSAPYQGAPIALQELRKHHLRPLAHQAGMAGLAESFAQAAVLAAMHKETLREIKGAFAPLSLEWTTIKGANYAWRLYPAPALRPMSDLDLIVPEDRFEDAIAALKSLGYRERAVTRRGRHAQTFGRRAHELVDLHRSILQPWRDNARPEDFWKRAQPSEQFTGSVHFCAVDVALVHIAHMARHEFVVPLISYVDLQLLLASLSDEEEELLRRGLGERELRFAFEVLQHLLGRLSGQATARPDARMRFVLPSDTELVRCRHRRRRAQIARKLAIFPSSAAPLLAGFCVRSLGDALFAATARRDSAKHSLRWRR